MKRTCIVLTGCLCLGRPSITLCHRRGFVGTASPFENIDRFALRLGASSRSPRFERARSRGRVFEGQSNVMHCFLILYGEQIFYRD